MTEQSLLADMKELEQQISTTKYNKRTEHAIGLMKVKLARMKEQLESQRAKKKQAQRPSYAVKRNGDATVALIGFPSVGKSTLINAITNANSKTASYNFTTLDCIPGLMEYKNAKIQILDLPGILEGASNGTGRGKEAISVLRNADLILLIADAYDVEKQLPVLRKELYSAGIRLNQRLPDVKIVKKIRGGIAVSSTLKLTRIKKEDIVSALKEFRIQNADVVVRQNINLGEFIDSITGNRKYAAGLFVINKIDMVGPEEASRIRKYIEGMYKKSAIMKNQSGIAYVMISAEKKINIDFLKEAIYEKLMFIRIFLKEVGKEADLEKPMIMREGDTVKDLCGKIHTSFIEKLRFARVWGKSAKFPGQKFKLEHKLKDGDIVQLHIK
jgi:small GTP-binding protein